MLPGETITDLRMTHLSNTAPMRGVDDSPTNEKPHLEHGSREPARWKGIMRKNQKGPYPRRMYIELCRNFASVKIPLVPLHQVYERTKSVPFVRTTHDQLIVS
ncbi:hypothetical protein [Microvirga tunisiensis]|uniref:Uncharacterized protein n=1 Tax=Microvirga tunisiensis TaxID=2108360 RepID=A0A5N7MU27_9HYPH|nr:hypothetical protein [Microvirga tunisiensis]MPR12481.1 hypothetical protein [Microvirga tunisiensis]MPR30388.1 hypothetical protein [Microvirga tunisiensis]